MKPKMPRLRSPTPCRLASRPGVTPVARPEQVGEDAARRHAAQQVRAQVAVHRRDDVVRTQRIAGADADRLVAALAERAAHAAALLPERHHALVKGARQAHPVVECRACWAGSRDAIRPGSTIVVVIGASRRQPCRLYTGAGGMPTGGPLTQSGPRWQCRGPLSQCRSGRDCGYAGGSHLPAATTGRRWRCR